MTPRRVTTGGGSVGGALPGFVDDLDAHGEPTLIENVQATHGHTVLSPNAIWVRRPRKSTTPLRSPDGIDRCADEEENWRMGTPNKCNKGAVGDVEEVTRTPKVKGRVTRAIDPSGAFSAGVSDGDKKSTEPERRSTRRRGRKAGGSGQGAPSPSFNSPLSAVDQTRSEAVAKSNEVVHGARQSPARAVGPELVGRQPEHQNNPTAEGKSKRRRVKSMKLQSDEFVVGDEASPDLSSREERSTDDDEFVPGGRRGAMKAAKDVNDTGRYHQDKCEVSGRPVDGMVQGVNASLHQARTPLAAGMPGQRHNDANVATQSMKTPSMNLFQHFQELQPSNCDMAGDIQKALEENIQAEADMKDISDLMAEIAKVNENAHAWEQMLESKTMVVEELRAQNLTLKELFAGLGLSKKNLSDFSMKDVQGEEERRKKMLSFGRRLVMLLRHGKGPKDGTADEPHGKAGMTGSVGTLGTNNGSSHLMSVEPTLLTKDEQDGKDWEDLEGNVEMAKAMAGAQHGAPMAPADTAIPAITGGKNELEERFHPIAAQVAGAGLHAAKGDPARAVMYLINKGFQARQADGFQGDPPPDFCTAGVAREGAKEGDNAPAVPNQTGA